MPFRSRTTEVVSPASVFATCLPLGKPPPHSGVQHEVHACCSSNNTERIPSGMLSTAISQGYRLADRTVDTARVKMVRQRPAHHPPVHTV